VPGLRRASVIGGSRAGAEECRLALEVGRELGRRGVVVVTGGLGGVMEAASRGAKEAGGLTVGILPTGSAEDANPWVDIAVPTGLGYARNALVASAGEAVIAVGGSVGTLTEICFALQRSTPVVALGSWELDPARLPPGASIHTATGPRDAVAKAAALAGWE